MKYASEAYLSYGALKFVQNKPTAKTLSKMFGAGIAFTATDMLESANENIAMLSSHIMEFSEQQQIFYDLNPSLFKDEEMTEVNTFLMSNAVADKVTKYLERVLQNYNWDYTIIDPIRNLERKQPLIFNLPVFQALFAVAQSSNLSILDFNLESNTLSFFFMNFITMVYDILTIPTELQALE